MRKRADVVLAIVDHDNPCEYVQIRGTAAAFDTQSGGRVTIRITPSKVTTQEL